MKSNDGERRENAKELDLRETRLRALQTLQRLRIAWLIASILCVGFLGWAMFIGIWTSYKGPFSVIGTVAAMVSTVAAAYFLLQSQPDVDEKKYDLVQLQSDRLRLAAEAASDTRASLRVYRIGALDDIDQYRAKAKVSRRYSNLLQWAIIVGSVAATSLTSITAGAAAASAEWVRWVAAGVSAVVSVAAGVTGFFKFRERGFNQQQTADAMEKHQKALELGIREYAGKTEEEALRVFAQAVEELKDEQRKRELQLEQSSDQKEPRQS
ncbi:DUF4231 domain-containing protein [Micromonospora sp. D93]|uniref:DUF4231 domain-containing protein n=1 Tax=Micromonospora sp. D93 TaxID=2824886 RepID=UPI001B399E90|nr:DUF4231 domain-containing protein [Micromonospora sp. D93]MBQ1021761.1 DUF4231 domain-containing protein [Micromonospora sp. D93]